MKKAFSLIELMIVVVILGIIASLVFPNLTSKGDEAKNKLTCIQEKNIAQSIKLFRLDNGRYPTTIEGINALIVSPSDKFVNYPKNGYFEDKKMPLDSWGNKFIYINSEDTFDIISLGADQTEGTDDDIYLSKCR
jgi:general secretion pathway protein G